MAVNNKTNNDIAVKTVSVIKEYQMGGTILQALKGIDVEIKRGEYISIMGPSGSGKRSVHWIDLLPERFILMMLTCWNLAPEK